MLFSNFQWRFEMDFLIVHFSYLLLVLVAGRMTNPGRQQRLLPRWWVSHLVRLPIQAVNRICLNVIGTDGGRAQLTIRNVFGGLGGMVFDPKTSLRCSRSLLSPLSPALGLVFSFRAISVLPPRSAILATPSSPRCSMSSRSCLRVTPYRLPAAMLRPTLTSSQHELGWTNLKY